MKIWLQKFFRINDAQWQRHQDFLKLRKKKEIHKENFEESIAPQKPDRNNEVDKKKPISPP